MSHPPKDLSAYRGYIEVLESILAWDSHFEWTKEWGAAQSWKISFSSRVPS
jgi:hypothetical protein